MPRPSVYHMTTQAFLADDEMGGSSGRLPSPRDRNLLLEWKQDFDQQWEDAVAAMTTRTVSGSRKLVAMLRTWQRSCPLFQTRNSLSASGRTDEYHRSPPGTPAVGSDRRAGAAVGASMWTNTAPPKHHRAGSWASSWNMSTRSPGKDFRYVTSMLEVISFDASDGALEVYGVKHGERMVVTSGATAARHCTVIGTAPVTGAPTDWLWVHFDGEAGATVLLGHAGAADIQHDLGWRTTGERVYVPEVADPDPDAHVVHYRTATGGTKAFSIRPSVCAPTGFFHSQLLQCRTGDRTDTVCVVVGVAEGRLWVHDLSPVDTGGAAPLQPRNRAEIVAAYDPVVLGRANMRDLVRDGDSGSQASRGDVGERPTRKLTVPTGELTRRRDKKRKRLRKGRRDRVGGSSEIETEGTATTRAPSDRRTSTKSPLTPVRPPDPNGSHRRPPEPSRPLSPVATTSEAGRRAAADPFSSHCLRSIGTSVALARPDGGGGLSVFYVSPALCATLRRCRSACIGQGLELVVSAEHTPPATRQVLSEAARDCAVAEEVVVTAVDDDRFDSFIRLQPLRKESHCGVHAEDPVVALLVFNLSAAADKAHPSASAVAAVVRKVAQGIMLVQAPERPLDAATTDGVTAEWVWARAKVNAASPGIAEIYSPSGRGEVARLSASLFEGALTEREDKAILHSGAARLCHTSVVMTMHRHGGGKFTGACTVFPLRGTAGTGTGASELLCVVSDVTAITDQAQ